jgi:heme-degrading monooxygenase HmoA
MIIMVALIATGKVKDPDFIKQTTALAEKIAPVIMKMFRGFRGVSLMMKEDGTFVYCSYWETREDIQSILESDFGKKAMEAKQDFFTEPIKMEYYDVVMQL